mgnify:CR=1 FL=1
MKTAKETTLVEVTYPKISHNDELWKKPKTGSNRTCMDVIRAWINNESLKGRSLWAAELSSNVTIASLVCGAN